MRAKGTTLGRSTDNLSPRIVHYMPYPINLQTYTLSSILAKKSITISFLYRFGHMPIKVNQDSLVANNFIML